MKKKISIFLVMALLVFVFVPALTLAQDETDSDQTTITEDTEEEVEKNYQNLDELFADLEVNEDLNSVEKAALKRKLTEYDEKLDIASISSVVDKILAEEIELGQGFVILSNLEKSVNNGFAEDEALKLINSYQDQENSGQFAFQTALELRKLSREDISGENSEKFAAEVVSIIEEKGEIETSELKQLAAEYRKEAREEKREQIKTDREKNQNSVSEKSLEKASSNNASENALNKDDKEKGNSNNAEGKAKGKDKSSNKNSKK